MTMRPNELLERCKAVLPRLEWTPEGSPSDPMAFADLGCGRRVVCSYQDYGRGYQQLSAKVIDTGRNGYAFTHAARSINATLSGCVEMAIKDVMDNMDRHLPQEEARVASMRACIKAMGGGVVMDDKRSPEEVKGASAEGAMIHAIDGVLMVCDSIEEAAKGYFRMRGRRPDIGASIYAAVKGSDDFRLDWREWPLVGRVMGHTAHFMKTQQKGYDDDE